MELEMTEAALLTVTGAGVFAGTVAQVTKQLFHTSARTTRAVALVSGVVVVMTATIATAIEPSVITFLLAAFVGMQAGLSASAGFDIIDSGLDHRVIELYRG